MRGTIIKTIRPDFSIHTYLAPEEGFMTTSHIVELKTQLLIVDTQFAIPFADEAADYARTLGKPITRVYVSHEHPDHWFGAERFGAPIYAMQVSRDEIATLGDQAAAAFHEQMGDLVPDHAIIPEKVVDLGEEIIDGVRFTFTNMRDGESANLLVIAVPDSGIVFAQDAIYNNVHLFIAERRFAGWKNLIETFKSKNYEVVLPGHGLPGGPEQYDFVVDYLTVAERLLASSTTPEELNAGLLDAFPHAGVPAVFDIQNRVLFPEA